MTRNVERLSELISCHEEMIRDEIAGLISALVEERALRIHRDWSVTEETKALAKHAAEAAVTAVLTSDWADLPGEVKLVHVDLRKTLQGVGRGQ